MFETDLSVLSPAEVLSAVDEFRVHRDRADVRILEAAVAFADLHPEPRRTDGPEGLPGMEQLKVYGGEGCPAVAEFAVAEFGAALEISSSAAAGIMSDALGLRHRLPRIWARLLAGEAQAWRACRIARASVALSLEAVAMVDQAVEKIINRVGPDRLKRIVDAALWRADPEQAERNAEEQARARGVWVGRSDSYGTNTLFIKAESGDVVRLNATIAALAEALKVLGDTDSLDRRRARVIGWLADPIAALRLLEAARLLARTRSASEDHGSETDARTGGQGTSAASGADGSSAPDDAFSHASLAERLTEIKARARKDARARAKALRAEIASAGPADGGGPKAGRGSGVKTFLRGVEDLGGGRRDLNVHLTDLTLASGNGVVRSEEIGPMLLTQVRELLGHDQVVVKPVIDLRESISVDAYEIPDRIRERVLQRDLYCMFPWCGRRATRSMDLDHVVPYDKDGPPGQTSTDNLGPRCRFHHRLRTFGGWICTPMQGNAVEWVSPSGLRLIVDRTGTRAAPKVPPAASIQGSSDPPEGFVGETPDAA